ncbi:hypothetical protein [Rhodococcus pyridinivorans]|uniref:hypothetical protein n=1 Tax=Rhodococcus pyridinivorans TaxID=103816 RepID=UPI0022837AEA|nr:hypothetical protein [Rhodococcus pyridinivorans]WAL48272.1 hypothetical protein OQN32_09490 [Rhodococcus pyridinivorans]
MSNSPDDVDLNAAARAKGLVLAWSNGNGTRETEYHLWKRDRDPNEPTFIASYVNENDARRHIEKYEPEA